MIDSESSNQCHNFDIKIEAVTMKTNWRWIFIDAVNLNCSPIERLAVTHLVSSPSVGHLVHQLVPVLGAELVPSQLSPAVELG